MRERKKLLDVATDGELGNKTHFYGSSFGAFLTFIKLESRHWTFLETDFSSKISFTKITMIKPPKLLKSDAKTSHKQ